MATGATLAELLIGVRAEAMQSTSPGLGQNAEAVYREAIQRLQRQLWLDFAWPHLRVDRDVVLQAGERYYDFPDDLALDRVESVHVRWGGRWHPVCQGIGPDEYNAYDSDASVRADPLMRWAPYENDQFEVWPVPATDAAQTIRFRGIRNLRPLVEPTDTSDLDRDLLVLYAAAEVVSESKSPRASGIARRAQQHYAKLRQRSAGSTGAPFVLGGGPAQQHRPRRPPLVAVDRGN